MKNHNRRDFIKQVSATGAVLATGAFVSCAEKASASCSGAGTEENIQSKLIIPKAQGLKISGTASFPVGFPRPCFLSLGCRACHRDGPDREVSCRK